MVFLLVRLMGLISTAWVVYNRKVIGEHLLRLFSLLGFVTITKLLIKMGVDVNAKDFKGMTPLLYACAEGHTKTVEILLDNRANREAEAKNGSTPLLYACARGHTKTVEILLDNRANIEAKEKNGWTALMLASRYGHTETVKDLVARAVHIYGENSPELRNYIDTKNTLGATARSIAESKKYSEIVQILDEHDRFSALMCASRTGNTDKVKCLLEKIQKNSASALVNQSDADGDTPLMLAARGGHVETVKVLLDFGANINAQDFDCYTPLMLAIISFSVVGGKPANSNGLEKTIQVLLDRCANIEVKNRLGRNATMIAIDINEPAILKIIVEFLSRERSQKPQECDAHIAGMRAYLKKKNCSLVEISEILDAYDAPAKNPNPVRFQEQGASSSLQTGLQSSSPEASPSPAGPKQ